MMIKFAFASLFVAAAVSASFSPPQFMEFMQKNHPEMLSKLAKRQTQPASTTPQGLLGFFNQAFSQALTQINAVAMVGQTTVQKAVVGATDITASSIKGIDSVFKQLTDTVTQLTAIGMNVMGVPTDSKKKRQVRPPASVVAENGFLGKMFASSLALVGKTVNDAEKGMIGILANAGQSTDGIVDDVKDLTIGYVSALVKEFDDIAQNLLVASTSQSLSENKAAIEKEAQVLIDASKKFSEILEEQL